jgi:hypothetical protein
MEGIMGKERATSSNEIEATKQKKPESIFTNLISERRVKFLEGGG